MKRAKIFRGNSHPRLAENIADMLGMTLAPATVSRFANEVPSKASHWLRPRPNAAARVLGRETSVEIGTSVRDEDAHHRAAAALSRTTRSWSSSSWPACKRGAHSRASCGRALPSSLRIPAPPDNLGAAHRAVMPYFRTRSRASTRPSAVASRLLVRKC